MQPARPRYHYAPSANWLSDPNGLVHCAGEWHMFYQYNPHGEDWGHMSWGHAVSADLAHWTELAPALVEDERHAIYSGSAVIDRAGSAGFGKDAMIAIYTGAREAPKHQVQCLAASLDRGRSWEKFAGNPVLDLGLADFRDPNVFWHMPTQRWVMAAVLSDENRCALFASPDLRDWTLLSHIETDSAPGHLWECPLLIELPVAGEGRTAWLFKVDVFAGAPGSGAIYRTGHFDGERFVPDAADWRVADHGSDFYAAIAWHEPRDNAGRPCWIGWMGNHAYQRALPLKGWRGAMSLPRRLSLVRAINGTLGLAQHVEPSSAARMVASVKFAAGEAPVAIPAASCLTLRLPPPGSLVAIGDGRGCSLALRMTAQGLHIERRDGSLAALAASCAVCLAAGDAVAVWLDHGSMELLSADGCVSATLQHRLAGSAWQLTASGAAVEVGVAVPGV